VARATWVLLLVMTILVVAIVELDSSHLTVVSLLAWALLVAYILVYFMVYALIVVVGFLAVKQAFAAARQYFRKSR
jgi:hypothetical protein